LKVPEEPSVAYNNDQAQNKLERDSKTKDKGSSLTGLLQGRP
jgi:hypothetical protein